MRSWNPQTVLNLPCPFCLIQLVLPCLERLCCSGVSLPLCVTFPFVFCFISLLSFLKTCVNFILFNTFACLWALGRMLYHQLFIWHCCHSTVSINVTSLEMFFSLSTLLRFSVMNSTPFIFFIAVISRNYLLIILSYIL